MKTSEALKLGLDTAEMVTMAYLGDLSTPICSSVRIHSATISIGRLDT